jgi:thiosulfate/3-mercaptopyruvate sulfurtransferase
MTATGKRAVLAGMLVVAVATTSFRGTLKRLHAAERSARVAASDANSSGRPSGRLSDPPAQPAANPAADSPSEPWTSAQTVQPEEFVKELGETKVPAAERPVVACVGFHVLYEGGHIPGASFHGPGSKDEGLADLKKWAQGLPRSANVVLYCGCCPISRCPNLRPAFTALRDMGFTRPRVLLLPQNFATDWAGKGYAVEKGK